METISNALFWISNGLLVPVVVLLLLFFARAVLLAGGFFGEFYRRVHTQKSLAEQLEELTPDNIEEKADSLTGDRSTPVQRCVYKLYTHRDNAAYCERLLANYLLIQLFFAFPGVSFGLITGISSVAVFILMSGLSLLLKNIVGERKLRLEILFITNLFIVLLSVVSTGNN